MLSSEIITLARELLQDTHVDTGYRHTDEKLQRNYDQALREVWRIRPDLFLKNDFQVSLYNAADATQEFPISDQYAVPFVEFIVGYTELADDEFVADNRAATLIRMFKAALLGVET